MKQSGNAQVRGRVGYIKGEHTECANISWRALPRS
jgi:hypothetical protein